MHRASPSGDPNCQFGLYLRFAVSGCWRVRHSSSYLAVLGLAATLTFDAGEYFPADQETRRDQSEWHGYHRGLQTTLACLIMHETGSNPQRAASQVAEHTETLIRCRWTSQPGPGGE
ncbi:hypothetical protein ABIA31_009432 [Catenulispora sp. MAP5-51]